MPDPPIPEKRQPGQAGSGVTSDASLRYAELHCRTNFSFLQGASHPDELVIQAAELGYQALAITDRNSLAGVVRAHAAAKPSALKLIVGAEITPLDAPPVVLLATDRAAYGQLARLITCGRRRAEKGDCELTVEDIAQHSRGLIAGVFPVACGDPAHGAPAASFTEPQRPDRSLSSALGRYRSIFSDRCYLFAELHYGVDDQHRLAGLIQLARRMRTPLVAAGDVHYHIAERIALQHTLTAIRLGTTVDQLGEHRLPNAERHLRSLEQIADIFAQVPEALQRTMEIADRCTFSLSELRYEYPVELAPPGETPVQYLRRIAWMGAAQKYGEVPEKIAKQLEHELEIIEELRYEAFFLTVYDIVKFARAQTPPILCQGRGSAANSAVCYCLGVTAVDPLSTDLLFERFVSRERNEAPDIDVDFEHERREEVLQYVYSKYGRDRAGIAATVITYRPKSAIRDVGKALGFSLDRVDALAKNVGFRGQESTLAERCLQVGIDPNLRTGQQLVTLVNQVLGFPRHLSQHVGGMVITEGPLCELVPIENAAMEDRTVIQWDKDDLDELGILKVDCLALGMLTAIHKSFDLIKREREEIFPAGAKPRTSEQSLTVEGIGQSDPAVYEMICRADTVGVFQIESRAQMSMLPRLRPQEFYDLVIEVAIVRPGPIQGDMVHPYLQRRDQKRNGQEIEPICADPAVNKVLERTLGVPLFQEQAMQLAITAAGFTPGEADRLRKAMGGWRRPGLIDSFKRKLIDGALARGHSEEFAQRLFKQISGFGEYGFPESHAASFAKLAYVSAWLKHYYPAAFAAALINSQPMGFYAPAQLIQDARDHDVEVRPVDVNHSQWDCELEAAIAGDSSALRLGLRLIRGLPRSAAEAIVQARNGGSNSRFSSLDDFVKRTGLSQAAIELLTEADAFRSLQLDRRSALWQALDPWPGEQAMPLLKNHSGWEIEAAHSGQDARRETRKPLIKLTEQEEVFADYRTIGFTLRKHPFAFCRQELAQIGVTPTCELIDYPNNRGVKVAGLVLMRQRPSTASGITFVTLEDETGIANLVIHKSTWDKHDLVARRASAMIAQGRLERKHEVIHIIVRRLEDYSGQVATLRTRSRDFR